MNQIRLIGTCIALSGIAMLSGCVAVPAGSYYGSPAYSQPYYGEPGPAVVGAPSVYIGGTYNRGPGYYPGPYYQGRPYFDDDRARGYGPRRPAPHDDAPRSQGYGGQTGAGGGWDPRDPNNGPGRGADRP